MYLNKISERLWLQRKPKFWKEFISVMYTAEYYWSQTDKRNP